MDLYQIIHYQKIYLTIYSTLFYISSIYIMCNSEVENVIMDEILSISCNNFPPQGRSTAISDQKSIFSCFYSYNSWEQNVHEDSLNKIPTETALPSSGIPLFP